MPDRGVEHVVAIGNRHRFKTVGAQNVAEQFAVEVVVFHNHYAFRHCEPRFPLIALFYPTSKDATMPQRPKPDDRSSASAATLALAALGWLLEDDDRAQRYLSLTGLDPDTLRAALGDASVLLSCLDFLANYEPDLIRAAEALAVTPEDLIEARSALFQKVN